MLLELGEPGGVMAQIDVHEASDAVIYNIDLTHKHTHTHIYRGMG